MSKENGHRDPAAAAAAAAAQALTFVAQRSESARSLDRLGLSDTTPTMEHRAAAPAPRARRAPEREPRKRRIWVVRVTRPVMPEEAVAVLGDLDAKSAAATERVAALSETVAEKQARPTDLIASRGTRAMRRSS